MKVLQVIDSLDVGGAERVCIDISNLLHKNNINVSILTIIEKGRLSSFLDKKIDLFCLNRKSRVDINAIKKMVLILREYDIIHIHMRHVFRYVKMVSLFYKIKGKLIFHDHNGRINVNKKPSLFMTTIFKPQYYIGVSRELTKWASLFLNIKKEQIFLLENIVIRKEYQKKNKVNTVVHVSNISPHKNQLFSIQLIEKTSYDLLIIGNVLDIKYYNLLKDYIFKHELGDRISFIHDETNIQSILNKFKFALMPSFSESGPLVLIEYLAQSLPFIAYKTGEVSNIISDELPFFIDSFDIDKWLRKIDRILEEDPTILLDTYYKYFNPDDYTKKCLKIYEKIKNY